MEYLDQLIDFLLGFPLDFFILGGIIVGLSACGALYGKDRLVALLFALYAAFAIFISIPEHIKTEQLANPLMELGLFFLLLLLGTWLINRMISEDLSRSSLKQWYELVTLSILNVLLFLAIAYQTLPLSALYDFSPAIDVFFVSEIYLITWFVLPLLALLTIRRLG